MRVYFSTLIILFLVTNVLVGLQFIPIWYFNGMELYYAQHEQNGWPATVVVYLSDNFGWPIQCVTRSKISWIAAGFDAAFNLAILYWVYLVAQFGLKYFNFRAVAWAPCLLFAGIGFGFSSLMFVVPLHFNSLTGPWWQGWRGGLFMFWFVLLFISVIMYLKKPEGWFVELVADRVEI